MSQADNLEIPPAALDAIKKLLNSSSRATRTTMAHVLGRFLELRGYSARELEEFKTDYKGVYAIRAEASPGTDIMIVFTNTGRNREVVLKILDAVEAIGPSQHDAALKAAQRFL